VSHLWYDGTTLRPSVGLSSWPGALQSVNRSIVTSHTIVNFPLAPGLCILATGPAPAPSPERGEKA